MINNKIIKMYIWRMYSEQSKFEQMKPQMYLFKQDKPNNNF